MKTLQRNEKLDYQEQNLYIGFDVHKKDWRVCILGDYLEHKLFSQPPDPQVLVGYLHNHFPGANYYSAYEAGFSGFWICDSLNELGVKTIVVNPSDIPTTHKEKKQKTDKRDARKIARELRSGTLKGIYVGDNDILEDRLLLRSRRKLLADIKRIKCRIKSQLMFFGIAIPSELDKPYWSKKFRNWLRSDLFQGAAQFMMVSQLETLRTLEDQKKTIEKQIVILANEKYSILVRLLHSIPGIGLLAAMTLIVELMDMKRFKTTGQLHSFLGLIPNVYASGDHQRIGRITKRHNAYLRPMLIQCAWRAAKTDPSLMLDYNKLCKRMKPNKAIIRIAKKLTNRIRYVWIHQKQYQARL